MRTPSTFAPFRIFREERSDEGKELLFPAHHALQDEKMRVPPRIADLLPYLRGRLDEEERIVEGDVGDHETGQVEMVIPDEAAQFLLEGVAGRPEIIKT